MDKERDPSVETTKFVNIYAKPWTIYTNGKSVFVLKPKEEKIMVLYIAQVGAKHLVTRILQDKGVRFVYHDTDLRKSLFAQILPELGEELDVKILSPEEEKEEVRKALKKQGEEIDSLKESSKEEKDKDSKQAKKIEELEKQVAQLKEGGKPKGKSEKVAKD